jgi:hypothetical protein
MEHRPLGAPLETFASVAQLGDLDTASRDRDSPHRILYRVGIVVETRRYRFQFRDTLGRELGPQRVQWIRRIRICTYRSGSMHRTLAAGCQGATTRFFTAANFRRHSLAPFMDLLSFRLTRGGSSIFLAIERQDYCHVALLLCAAGP